MHAPVMAPLPAQRQNSNKTTPSSPLRGVAHVTLRMCPRHLSIVAKDVLYHSAPWATVVAVLLCSVLQKGCCGPKVDAIDLLEERVDELEHTVRALFGVLYTDQESCVL